VISQDVFAIDAWSIPERELHLDPLAQTESIFALANGHIGLRGNLDEGELSGIPGTYLNGFYEIRPLPSAEAAYGNPEAGQTIINVTNGKLIRLLVDDEPSDALLVGGQVAACVAGVRDADRLDEQYVGLAVRLWAVLKAARDDEQLSRLELDVAIGKLDRQSPARTRKKSSVSGCECQTNSPFALTSSSL